MRFVRVVTLAFCAMSVFCAAARSDEAALLAREHFRRGTKAYNLQHFAEAAAEYEAAYEAKELPALLYNIGQAYRYAGEKQKAINAYRSFLRSDPSTEQRQEVLGYIEQLRQQLADDKAKQPPPTVTPPVVAPPPSTVTPPLATTKPETPPAPVADPRERARGLKLRAAGIGVAAVGVVGVVLGGVFAGLTASANDKLNHPAATTPPPAYDKSLESRARTYQALTPAMFAVGGVALVGGVTLALIGNKKVQHNRYALVPVVGPGHVAASLSVGF